MSDKIQRSISALTISTDALFFPNFSRVLAASVETYFQQYVVEQVVDSIPDEPLYVLAIRRKGPIQQISLIVEDDLQLIRAAILEAMGRSKEVIVPDQDAASEIVR